MRRMIKTSIFKKVVVAFAGSLLCVFAIFHLAGNLLLLVSAEAFNRYSEVLISNPFIYLAEILLLLIVLTHIFLGLRLQLENYRARPQKYQLRKHSGHSATFASSTMPYTGTILLVYLFFHIWHLKFGAYYGITYDGIEIRDIQRLVIEYFANPLTVGLYLIAMAAFGVHLSHGFWSIFQTIGFNHVKYTAMLKRNSIIFGVVMTIGFSILPIWAYLLGVAS